MLKHLQEIQKKKLNINYPIIILFSLIVTSGQVYAINCGDYTNNGQCSLHAADCVWDGSTCIAIIATAPIANDKTYHV